LTIRRVSKSPAILALNCSRPPRAANSACNGNLIARLPFLPVFYLPFAARPA
jgi:hypothetical protein